MLSVFSRLVAHVAAFGIFLCSFHPCLQAQSQAIDGNIEGFVRDPNGAFLADSKIRIINNATRLTRDSATDDNGFYRVQLLPPGTYTVSCAKPGFSTAEKRDVTLAAGQVTTLDLQLKVGEVSTTIEVTESIPVVETGRTNAYNNIYTSREVRNIPVAGRSFLDFFVVNPVVNAPPLSTGG
ncbi:MAG: carboxypeptidase regulatory-like domain-containing protein, partial [Bryobacteraceae bacterium]|nr:carboxypeptidase regulatory-like domain-containing protein [Bryobacteraceae bacterium]